MHTTGTRCFPFLYSSLFLRIGCSGCPKHPNLVLVRPKSVIYNPKQDDKHPCVFGMGVYPQFPGFPPLTSPLHTPSSPLHHHHHHTRCTFSRYLKIIIFQLLDVSLNKVFLGLQMNLSIDYAFEMSTGHDLKFRPLGV